MVANYDNTEIRSPTAGELAHARKTHGLTQADAARMLPVSLRTWQGWEAGRPMPPAMWRLFNLELRRTGQ